MPPDDAAGWWPEWIRRRAAVAIIVAGTVAAVGLGCRQEPPLDLVIVTFDTTRADAIGCYGNADAVTPTVDALAAEGTRFASAHTAVPITLPSHTTLMTGMYPTAHGVRDNGIFHVGDEQQTLAEMLSAAGYRTAAAVGSFPLAAQFGLDQGFELYDDHFSVLLEDIRGRRSVVKQQLFFDERPAGLVRESLEPWLEEHHAEPFFVWLHFFDPHQPLRPPPPYDQLFAADPYLGEIAYADETLGRLISHLRDLGVWDRTLLVLAADHGEGRGQHGELTHSTLNYETTLHVPLVIRDPRAPAGVVVEQPVGLVDVVPTVLELLGQPTPQRLQGRSLAPVVRGEIDPDALPAVPLYAETLSSRLSQGLGELRTIIAGRHKLIWGPRPELYDLAADPGESDNLLPARPERAADLERQLEDLLERIAVRDKAGAVAIDDASRQRLVALGYLQGGMAADEEITEVLRSDGTPPQDRVGDISDVTVAKNLLLAGDALQARRVAGDLLDRAPDNVFYLQLEASAEVQLGRLQEAFGILERIRRLDPRGLPADQALLQVIGMLYRNHRLDEAITLLADQQQLSPSPQGQWALASLYDAVGRRADHLAALQAALDLDPDFAAARVDLAAALAERGETAAAEASFREALERQPYYAKGHYNFGVFLHDQGQLAAAASHFRRAVELEPEYLRARHALVVTEASLGEHEAAAAALAELEAQAPGSPETAMARQFLRGVQ